LIRPTPLPLRHAANQATFDFVERIVRLVAFDSVALTLLLMWMGVYDDRRVLAKKEEKSAMFRV